MDPLYATIIFVFGLAFGSFLNVCIYRLPRAINEDLSFFPALRRSAQSLVNPSRSACPGCRQEIAWYDNVPVLSWVMLRGRCRKCGMKISARYAAVELLTALLFIACYAQFGLTLEALKFGVFSFLVIGLIFTDAETKLLPDSLTLPGLAMGLALSLIVPVHDVLARFLPSVISMQYPQESWRWLSFGDAILGAIVGASFIYGSGMMYKLARGVEGMGFGDVKLMAMIGAFLGLKLTLFTIFGASILGALFGLSSVPAVWMKRTRRHMLRGKPVPVARRQAWASARNVYRYYAMPFGVFLGTMSLLAVFAGDWLLQWYWNRYF